MQADRKRAGEGTKESANGTHELSHVADGLRRRAVVGAGAPAPLRGGHGLEEVEAAQAAETALEGLLEQVVCSVAAAGCWLPVPLDWSLRRSVPPNYVAMLCVRGGAEYQIGEETYALRPGGLLLCPPRVPRTGRHNPTDPLHLYSVHFQARLYGTLDMPAVYGLPVAMTPTPERHARMVQASQRIVAELDKGETGHGLAANGVCAELLALIWRDASSGSRGVGERGRAADLARLAPVFKLIEAQYARQLTLEQLAGAVHLQAPYFSTLFRRLVGTSPMRYVARYRLDRARDLLLSTDLPLGEIARRTGFSEGPYLNRVFREAEGMTPGAYRRTKENPLAP
jgi:AraC-like DNA-binding protein